jgi:hypothetical protein
MQAAAIGARMVSPTASDETLSEWHLEASLSTTPPWNSIAMAIP